MNTLAIIFIFLLGTIIGSFLNVVIYRFNTGKSITKGRSICMSCNKKLRWYELIPVLSFLIQSGKCRNCARKISHQYPIVELVTGVIFTIISLHFLNILSKSIYDYIAVVGVFTFLFSLLVVISVYDIRHKIIPDKLVYIYAFVSFITIFINQNGFDYLFIKPSMMEIISGPIFALPFAFLWLISSGKWMGLGDAKLVLGLGWMLGPLQSIAMLTLSFWIGALVSLFVMLFTHKKVNMKTEIPFAPFLILSTLIVFIFNLDIFSLVEIFSL